VIGAAAGRVVAAAGVAGAVPVVLGAVWAWSGAAAAAMRAAASARNLVIIECGLVREENDGAPGGRAQKTTARPAGARRS
jgi:hypothetical protein